MDSTVKLCFVSIWSFAKYLTAFRSRRVFRSLSNIYNETFFPKIINGSIVDARMSFKYASDLLSKIYWQYRFIQNHSRLFLAKDFSKFSNNFNLLCKGVSPNITSLDPGRLYQLKNLSLCEQCPNMEFFLVWISFSGSTGKYGLEKIPNLETFHIVYGNIFAKLQMSKMHVSYSKMKESLFLL